MEIVENLIVSSGFLFLTNYTPFSHHTRFCYQTSAFAKNNCRLHLHLPPLPGQYLGTRSFLRQPPDQEHHCCFAPHHGHEQPTPDLQHNYTFFRPRLHFHGQSNTFFSVSKEMLSAVTAYQHFLEPSSSCLTAQLMWLVTWLWMFCFTKNISKSLARVTRGIISACWINGFQRSKGTGHGS